MFILRWDEACARGAREAGGKGWNLGRLHRYQFPVPAGGVVSAGAYQLFLRDPALQEQIALLGRLQAAEVLEERTASLLERLRATMVALPLPSAIAGELHAFLSEQGLLDRPVAVRSSATAEDSAVASFAGIHQSFLHVTGLPAVVDALKKCYASLWTPQAVAYRRKLGLPDEEVAAAVVVMAMVDAKAAGVGFTCDPKTGRRDRFTISASLGLGEAVVSGAVEPDEYAVDVLRYPPAVVGRRTGKKEQITVQLPEGGTALVKANREAAGRPALRDAQVAELTLLMARVRDALGGLEQPQDIEWAHDGERFWLVQARPVTHLPPPAFPATANQPVFWSNANLRDVMPGVQSALGWSFLHSGIDILLTAPLSAAGWPHGHGMTWARLFQGRAYFNLSAMQWAFYDALGMEPAEFNRVIGGHQPEIELPPATITDKVRRGVARLRTVLKTQHIMKEAPGDFRRLWAWADGAEDSSYEGWSKEQLLQQMLAIKERMEWFLPRFNLINGAAGALHQELIKLLAPQFGQRATGLVNALLTGVTGITSAEQGERLIELGNLALEEEPVRTWFASPEWDPADRAQRLASTRFAAAFQRYLKEYGHRAVYELELMNPRWKEEPRYLLEVVRSQVLGGRPIQLPDRSSARRAAEREVFARLALHPKRLQVRYFLGQAALASAQREMAKSVVVKVAGISRYAALETGWRMVKDGLLDQAGDIFHLSWVDVEAYLTGRSGCEGFRALVADRKAQRAIHLTQEAPDVIMGETPIKKAPPPAAAGKVLTGMGVATGRSAGIARVIRHPEEGSRLRQGEILVAPSTDPAWTPLFLRAAGVVVEVGGYLSHGSIVAREYGLPAVVNIPGLLAAVKDGETLTVDGDEGKVYRH